MDLILKNVSGVNEAQDPESLKETEVTVLKNLVLNKSIGKPTKRGGLNIFNSNSTTGLYSLHDVADGSGNNLLVGAVGTTFQKSSAGTGAWSSIKTGLTTSLKTRVQAYNNLLYVTNGTDAPFVTDFTSSYSFSVVKPDTSGVTSTNNTRTGLTPNAVYYWCLVYVTSTGDYSNPSAPFTHFAGTGIYSVNTTYPSVNFAALPVSSDTRVVRKLVFRTKANENIFYLCQSIDNSATTWTDSNPDTALDLSEYITLTKTVSVGKYITAHQERIWLGNVTVNDFVPDMVYGTVSSMGATTGYSFRGSIAVGEGSLVSGTYIYRIVYIDATGKVSGYRATPSLSVSTNDSVYFYNVPVPMQAEYQIKLYRSKDGGAYYYLPIDPRYDGDTGSVAVTADTMPAVTSSTTSYKSAVLYSEIGKPSQINEINITQVTPDDGDEITGILDETDGVLVFKRNSIAKIYTFGSPLNWRIQTLSSQIGCDDPNSIQKVGNRIYFRSNKQVYRYPDRINIPVSIPKKTTLLDITSKDSAYSNYYQWYILIGTTSTSVNKVIIYDELLESWYEFDFLGNIANLSVVEKTVGSTNKGTLLFGGTYVLKYDESISVDYEAVATTKEIVPTLTSKTYTMEDPTVLFRPRVLFVDYKKKDDQTATFTLSNPEESGQTLANTDSTNSTVSSDYKNYKIVTDAMTAGATQFKYGDKLIFTASGAGITELNAMRFQYRTINRGRRVQ